MPTTYLPFARFALATAAIVAASMAGVSTQAPQGQKPQAVFRSSVDLVTVNVVVRDKDGKPVRGLTRDDFTVYEDDRAQPIATFDMEELPAGPEGAPAAAGPTVMGVLGKTLTPKATQPAAAPPPDLNMKGRRLIAMLFDLTSMQPEELERSVKAARDYIDHKLSPVDMLAVVALSTSLTVHQDFTSDKAAMLAALDRMSGVEGQGFDATAAASDTSSDAVGFAPDDSEFDVFNTDRRLLALETLIDAMKGIEQKKSLIYFSSGMTQTGMDNRVAIRTAIDHAVRANVSIYSADMRGLQALAPGGDASQASARGQSAFSGQTVSARFDQLASSQDALSSLAEDTGGRAFFDENDFGRVFDRVVADTSVYYILGFSSSNRTADGRFRRLRVKVKGNDVKLEYRAGYYAARDFAHSGRDDREQQLTEQLFSDLSVTDLPVYATAGYFRMKADRYFVPLWLAVPGARIPFDRAKDKDRATLDVLAILRDEQQRPVARIRDTVKLNLSAAEDVKKKTVQYETSLELPPGRFRLKVVVRENAGGTMGSFETDLVVPNLARLPLKLSSIVLGNGFVTGAKRDDRNPLVAGGQELSPNIARVLTPAQHLYLYYEVYDPSSTPAPAGGSGAVRLLSNVVFFRGQQRVLETPLVETTDLAAADRKAAAFRLDIPPADLPPGLYTCQVNVIDDVAGTFAFPRIPVYVRKQ